MIHIKVPSLPPSVNEAYHHVITKVKGKLTAVRKMTKEGERYTKETQTFIVQQYPSLLRLFRPDVPYTLIIECTFHKDRVFSKTWPKVADNRYKTLDTSNRIKVFEDAFVKATGIDDRHNFFFGASKYWTEGEVEETNLWAWCPELEWDPIHELLRTLRASRTQPH
jgi:hypothetical protein